jgi:hypothetical protein
MKAVMIYDDFDCAARAGAMLQRAARRTEAGARWDIKPWRVDVLRLAVAGDQAMSEALDADLIVFAGRRACSMPTWVESWLENWAKWRTVGHAGLAAVRNEAGGTPSAPIALRLSRFAARHGLLFVAENRASAQSNSASPVRAPTGTTLPVETQALLRTSMPIDAGATTNELWTDEQF